MPRSKENDDFIDRHNLEIPPVMQEEPGNNSLDQREYDRRESLRNFPSITNFFDLENSNVNERKSNRGSSRDHL
ncbi:hypothetical protein HZH68_000113 [Vespula germanica]|uniref:Uncharacterized protein n=1 Tax=Vespula germanica TaxID=30212 RepID=A0A834NSZ1_VESGE|nr:hypothetical protein HZH68_000113 [Vespula germanica]